MPLWEEPRRGHLDPLPSVYRFAARPEIPGCTHSPRGRTPVTLAVGGTRQKLSTISTVTNQGKASWTIVDGAFKHEGLIELFELLVADGQRVGKKVFLILDNLGVHHGKPVKAWLAGRRGQIEVFCRPSCRPALNPDEHLEHAIGTKVPVRTKAMLQTAADEHGAFIEANAERVQSCFQDPRVRYAA